MISFFILLIQKSVNFYPKSNKNYHLKHGHFSFLPTVNKNLLFRQNHNYLHLKKSSQIRKLWTDIRVEFENDVSNNSLEKNSQIPPTFYGLKPNEALNVASPLRLLYFHFLLFSDQALCFSPRAFRFRARMPGYLKRIRARDAVSSRKEQR